MIGTTLGPYRIDRELGSGGMGRVYAATVAARCLGFAEGARVALKVVHPHLLEAPGYFQRFLREAEIGKSVVHENVVRTYGCDSLTVDGRRADFLTMEYVEGQTLRSLLQELDRVPEELCRHIGREVAKGLAAIHAAGVVHRDVKPENVIISRCTAPGHDHPAERPGTQLRGSDGIVQHRCEHVVKVMDLGVARLHDETLRVSQTGNFAGSIHYAAPECFSDGGRHVDGRADLHALGLVLYELSCGTNPYFADDVSQILKKVLHEEPRRLGDVNPQLSPLFEEVVHNLLAKRPDDRFADAATLVRVLEEVETSAWWEARAKSIRAETQRPLRRVRISRETAVYGREDDLAKLHGLFERAKAGDGQVVLVEGEAGIGKSRVVDELIGRLQRDGEKLHFLFGSYPPGGAATSAGAFSTAFREQFGDAGSSDHLTQTPILVPAFDALLKGESTPTGVEALTKDSLQTCFVHATRNLAAERTTVLLIDDLHFATEEARALFTSLAMAVPGHRVLLVGTMRPGIDEKWIAGLTRLPQTTQIALQRLGPKDLAALLQDSLKSESLALSLAGQIGRKSDGNPFFAFEIIRGLRDGRFLTQTDDGAWVSARVIDDIRIPSSILDLVNARVADLTEEERELLDVAACWGFEFDATLICECLGRARIPTLRQLALIEKRHRLVRCAGERFAFDHHQVQEALYGALPPQLAREYHAALASALESRAKAADRDPETLDGALCVDLCEHFASGAQAGRATRYLAAAQAHLEKGCLNVHAAALAERALAVPGLLAGAERAKALLRLAGPNGPLDRLGRRARQEEAAREAEHLAEEAGDAELRGQAARALGTVFWRSSRPAEAESAFRRAIEVVKARGDRKAEAAATGNLGNVFWSEGRLAEARACYEESLALSRETSDRRGEAISYGNLGAVFHAQGRLADARRHLEQSLEESRAIGNRQGEAAATHNLGNVLFSQGRVVEAREQFERSLALSREIGNRLGEVSPGLAVANGWLALGDRVRARQELEQCLALCREIGAGYVEGAALQSLGLVAGEEGDLRTAERLLGESLAVRRRIAHRDGVAETLVDIADLRRRAGDADGARTALDEAVSLSHELGAAPRVALAKAMLACLPGGDAADALACLTADEERLGAEERRMARWLLWQATGDRAQLVEAKRLLDESLAKVPVEHHAAMLANVRLNREIVTACKEQGV